ncbi:MAG: DUF502 domain-containing protein [Campylobacterales bacterium]|nr:DUF502 domain-containing protein [Campylobacterales bacterium]
MKTFLNGLGLIIPTAIIFYLLIWLLQKTEAFFKKFLLFVMPDQYYITGMGFIAGVIFVYFIGILLRFWVVQQFRDFLEKIINKMPIISSVYGGIKDFMNFFSNMKNRGDKITVLADIPAMDAKLIGFIMLEDFRNFKDLDMEDPVVVYFQMSYQIGGYSLFIPKKNLTFVDMSIEESLRFVMTAGISNVKGRVRDEQRS